MNADAIDRTLTRLTERLLDARNGRVHWTGRLSDSALSTATAVIALYLAEPSDPLVAAGLAWLERTQNDDGGFGDTTRSISNLSTTALCWAAFSITGRRGDPMNRAAAYVRGAAGGLAPSDISRALTARYGGDRTFSVPILTVLAVAGIVPWSCVPALPFELAACPRAWFSTLGLPVVSYALPALIAIGQVRHRLRPSKNLAARFVRAATARRTLNILERIQPPNGGYLEATPLTSFVCISLLAAGMSTGAVLSRGLDFLRRSARADGAWPIDTNLATWATTLSVNALRGDLPQSDREPIAGWLVAQQGREVHLYTGAAAGAWAWTNLPGGVPDADDTAGALVALHNLGASVAEAAARGVTWLLDLQNRDGGIPTFCRGWGKLPFDRSSADITAHALQAWSVWLPALDVAARARAQGGIARAVDYLAKTQRPDGAWTPLWFGNQLASGDENPVYGTARVILGLERARPDSPARSRALQWLSGAQNDDGGWGGDRGIPSSIEETALAVAALAGSPVHQEAALKGAEWLVTATRFGEQTPAAPIGLYFARLWYFEEMYPLVFAVDALERVVHACDATGSRAAARATL